MSEKTWPKIMMKKKEKEKESRIITGLDVGTSKVCAVVAELLENGQINVKGVGQSAAKGVRQGTVINIEHVADCVDQALQEAEEMAGVEVGSAFVSLGGCHLQGFSSRGVMAINGRGREVKAEDVNGVILAGAAVPLPADRKLLQVLPQEFKVDDQDGIKEPVGVSGVRLEAEVYLIHASVASITSLLKSVQKSGIQVDDLVVEHLAASEAVLDNDEKELGTVLVDIGAGTTNVIIYVHGSVCHVEVLPLGGHHFTNDISIGLRTPMAEAELIKNKYGCTLSSLIEAQEDIDVPSVGGRKSRTISRHVLCEIIEPRAEELFNLIDQSINKTGVKPLMTGGAVLTGGACLMQGMTEIAERTLGLPVRRGYPKPIGGLMDVVNSPIQATAVGLVLYGARYGDHHSWLWQDTGDGVIQRVWQKISKSLGGR